MSWNFWKKNKTGDVRLSKPKDLESRVGKKLVVELQYDPDWVWYLKCVTVSRKEQKSVFDFRIFDPVQAKMQGIEINDYRSLDAHPNLIYFDGWYDKFSWEINLTDHYKLMNHGTAA